MTDKKDGNEASDAKRSQKEIRDALKSVREGSAEKKILNGHSSNKRMVINLQTKLPRGK
jgi:hypothetical protein